jgi:hypothetical protein
MTNQYGFTIRYTEEKMLQYENLVFQELENDLKTEFSELVGIMRELRHFKHMCLILLTRIKDLEIRISKNPEYGKAKTWKKEVEDIEKQTINLEKEAKLIENNEKEPLKIQHFVVQLTIKSRAILDKARKEAKWLQ